MAPLKLEGPAPSLPREVKDNTSQETAREYVKAAERVAPVGGALFDFGGEDIELDHAPPDMTIAEEKRLEAGLPRKPYRPHIRMTAQGPEPVSTPTTSLTSQALFTKTPVAARLLFEQIRDTVTPLLKERNAKVKDIGFAVVALTAQGLALNYEDESNE